MDDAVIPILGIILRIVGLIVCINKAEELNRSQTGWGIFGFLLPIIAMIWIHCMKPVIKWTENKDIHSR
jgi:predicted membrane channel-forming protein YqfA (hemolysin III family)